MKVTVKIKHSLSEHTITKKFKNKDQVNGFLLGITTTLDMVGLSCEVLHTIDKDKK
jgi:hypothetical protein